MEEVQLIDPIETKRLLLIPYYREYVEATIEGHAALEKRCGYKVAEEWPGIDFFFYLPFALEQMRDNPMDAQWTRLIVLKETGEVIGEIGGQGAPTETKEVELGYSIVPRCQNKGYMTEAIEAMIRWFISEKMTRITAKCFTYNLASKHVLQKSDFELDYCDKDIIYWYYPLPEDVV